MKNEFETDFAGYKDQAAIFFHKLKAGATKEQIEAGLKALGLAFMYMTGTDNEKYQSEIVLQLAHKKVMDIELLELLNREPASEQDQRA